MANEEGEGFADECPKCGGIPHAPTEECDTQPHEDPNAGTPNEDLTELDRFALDPLGWFQEWNDKNGDVTFGKLASGQYVACLYVEGQEVALSTGAGPDLPHAFRNAIKGLDGLSYIG